MNINREKKYIYSVNNNRNNRNNIYTNRKIDDQFQDNICFSSPRPLSADQPYRSPGRLINNYLRQKQKSSKAIKPLKIGISQPSREQNINLYFNRKQYDKKLKPQQETKNSHSKSTQKNIYISKNINTYNGKGEYKRNYQNLFITYLNEKDINIEQKPIKNHYIKYKKKQAFNSFGYTGRTFSNNNQLCQNIINSPYNKRDQQHQYRAKSSQNKLLNRFKWKPTTQFVKKVES